MQWFCISSGIMSKLEYLKELGVGIISLSPIYASFAGLSFATDSDSAITNHTAINMNYGGMEDFDKLVEAVHNKGEDYLDRVKRFWYLSPMRAAKVQASLRIRAVSPEPSLLAHTSSESRGTFRQKARSLAPLNGWACAVKICHDGMLEDTNSLDGAHLCLNDSLDGFLVVY